MEKKHHIRERWSDLSRVFVTITSRLYEKRKSELLSKLHCMAFERCFLVELKRKYAGNKLKKLLCKIFSSMCILVIMVCSNSVVMLLRMPVVFNYDSRGIRAKFSQFMSLTHLHFPI